MEGGERGLTGEYRYEGDIYFLCVFQDAEYN